MTKRAGDEPLTRLTGTYMSDAHFGGHLDLGRRFGENKQFGIRFNGVYRDGETALNDQKDLAGRAWARLARCSRTHLADLYQSQERGNGLTVASLWHRVCLCPNRPNPMFPGIRRGAFST